MNPELIEKMIADGRDSYEARLAAAQARLKAGDVEQAAEHFGQATQFKPGHTAAWQGLGQAWDELGRLDDCRAAWQRGLEVARDNGDVQAEKVLTVWLKRLNKRQGPDPSA